MNEKNRIASSENSALIVPDEVDNLNREEFVDNVKTIISNLAGNRKNAAFAINGSWGVGKTWVLNRLEKDLNDNYFIVRYNAWENDYYDEPLTAILSVFVDRLNAVQNRERTAKGITKAIAKNLAMKLARIIGMISKNKLGIDIMQFGADIIKDVKKGINAEKLPDCCIENLSIQSLKNDIRAALGEITGNATVIVMVDELDRCLPDYAITVLERLHHLFNGIPNLQVIAAVDKDQVEKTLENIFGSEVNKEKYLQKFFDFELTLDKGETGKNFDDKYGDYCSCFECQLSITKPADVEAFKRDIFELDGLEKLDGRDKDRIIEKAFLLHKMLLDKDKKYDYLYFCVEVTLAILCATDKNKGDVLNNSKIQSLENLPITHLRCLKDKLGKINIRKIGTNTIILPTDIWSAVWKLFVRMYDVPNVDTYMKIESMPELKDIAEHLDDVVKWLKILN